MYLVPFYLTRTLNSHCYQDNIAIVINIQLYFLK